MCRGRQWCAGKAGVGKGVHGYAGVGRVGRGVQG